MPAPALAGESDLEHTPMGYLRLFLASCVVIAHIPLAGGAKIIPGPVAVEIFFMLSGFYMALVLDGKYRAESWSQISTTWCTSSWCRW